MNEDEWRTSVIPRAMLMALKKRARTGQPWRRWRLFACACARRVWHLLEDERSRYAIEVAERYADGLANIAELDFAFDAADLAAWHIYSAKGLHAAYMAKRHSSEGSIRPASRCFGESAGERAWIAARSAFSVTRRKVGVAGTKLWFEEGAWAAALTASLSAWEALADVAVLRAREAIWESSPEAARFYEAPWQADLLRCIFGNPYRH